MIMNNEYYSEKNEVYVNEFDDDEKNKVYGNLPDDDGGNLIL